MDIENNEQIIGENIEDTELFKELKKFGITDTILQMDSVRAKNYIFPNGRTIQHVMADFKRLGCDGKSIVRMCLTFFLNNNE